MRIRHLPKTETVEDTVTCHGDGMKRTSILLADDHTMICAALQKLLEPEYEVIGCVGDGRALVKTAVDLQARLGAC